MKFTEEEKSQINSYAQDINNIELEDASSEEYAYKQAMRKLEMIKEVFTAQPLMKTAFKPEFSKLNRLYKALVKFEGTMKGPSNTVIEALEFKLQLL